MTLRHTLATYRRYGTVGTVGTYGTYGTILTYIYYTVGTYVYIRLVPLGAGLEEYSPRARLLRLRRSIG